MGLLFSRPRDEGTYGSPPLRTPFSDVTGTLGLVNDLGYECTDMHLRWMDCVEAYGAQRGREKCSILFQDFMECHYCWKREQRGRDMCQEREYNVYRYLLGKGPYKPYHPEGGTPEWGIYRQAPIDDPANT